MIGKLIVLEGLDSSGKSTQASLLLERLEREGKDTTLIKSPNRETSTGKLIYEHLEEKWVAVDIEVADKIEDGRVHEGLTTADFWKGTERTAYHPGNALLLQALQTVNRYEDAPGLRLMLAGGVNVVHDRYFTSGEVYGAVDGLDRDWLRTVHVSLPQPDLVLFIDVELEESIRRRPERRDRYEANAEFLGRVRDEYTRHFLERSREGLPYVIIDGHGLIEEVHNRIWSMVNTVFTQGRRMDGGPIL